MGLNQDPGPGLTIDQAPGIPDALQYPRTPVEVWMEADTPGEFEERSDLFAARSVSLASDTTLDTARLTFVFDENAWPMVDQAGGFQSDYLSLAMQEINRDRRIRIFLADANPIEKTPLFEGYPMTHTLQWTSSPKTHNQVLQLDVTSILQRWRYDPEAQVIGRWVHGNRPRRRYCRSD